MSREISRRSLLRLGTIGAAGGLVAVGASGRAWGASSIRSEKNSPLDAAADRIAASVRRPVFPDREFPVTRFGARGDGTTLDTAAFAAAIAACHRAGGGHVVVPSGSTFLTGAIHLKSNVDLHVEGGAAILFSQDPNDYLPVVWTRWQGIELMNYSPPVYCFGQSNVGVTGSGTLNGNADANHWWNWKNSETDDFNALEAQADAGVPVPRRVYGPGHYLPPQMIQPYRSDRVLLSGVTVINSPFWHLNPNLCTNVTIEGLTISSSGPNTDGCDPESCDGVLVRNVTYSTGDDCMAIKSGRDADGRRVNVPCQNVVIENCDFADGHGGITIGSEMSGGVRNVYARDLTMNSANLQAGHRVKSNLARGGYVENSNVYRVTAGTVGGPLLLIDGDYSDQAGTYPPDLTGITISDWTVDSCEGLWSITGASASDPVGTATLRDVAVTTSTAANSAEYITDLVLDNVTVGGVPVTG